MPSNRYKVVRNALTVLGNQLIDEIDENFEDSCRRLLESSAKTLVLDFGGIGCASSICVVMAAKIFFETRRSGKTLKIKGKKPVLKIFKMCGFDYDSRIVLEASD